MDIVITLLRKRLKSKKDILKLATLADDLEIVERMNEHIHTFRKAIKILNDCCVPKGN